MQRIDFEALERTVDEAARLRDDAAVAYKEGNYKAAARLYHTGLLHTKSVRSRLSFGGDGGGMNSMLGGLMGPSNPDDQPRRVQLQAAADNMHGILANNLAAVHLKLGNWSRVIEVCTECLERDGACVKALSRRAKAHMELHQYIKAEPDVNVAIQLTPTDLELVGMQRVLDEWRAECALKERARLRGMFDRPL